MASVIYMFHAIGELADGDWADPHYSFSKDKFCEFLVKVKSVLSIEQLVAKEDKQGCVLTFDDGHVSNYWAGKYIAENGYGSANFFINPVKVGSEFYMSWVQLKELSDLGMSIQSHGLDHQFLSELNNEELSYQLAESKNIIEEKLGRTVSIIAPPGGRYDKRTIIEAKRLGYQMMPISQPGRIKKKANFLQPRIAVMNTSSVEQLLDNQYRFNLRMLNQTLKYSVLKSLKSALGNDRYERIRWFILGDGK